LAFLHNVAGGDAEPIMSVSLQQFKGSNASQHEQNIINFPSCKNKSLHTNLHSFPGGVQNKEVSASLHNSINFFSKSRPTEKSFITSSGSGLPGSEGMVAS